jgi:hypothetical protein
LRPSVPVHSHQPSGQPTGPRGDGRRRQPSAPRAPRSSSVPPTRDSPCLGRIAAQRGNLGRTEAAGIDVDVALPVESDSFESQLHSRTCSPGRDHEVLRLVRWSIIHIASTYSGAWPQSRSAFRFPRYSLSCRPAFAPRHGPRDRGSRPFPPSDRPVVEQDPVAGEQVVRLPGVHRRPVREHLGNAVGAARVERLRLALRWREPSHTSPRMTPGRSASARPKPVWPPASGSPIPVAVRRVLGHLEAHLDVALRTEV